MGNRTEEDFLEWLSGINICVGYARYGGHGFVCVGTYDEHVYIRGLVEDLEGGDEEAFAAERKLHNVDCWIGHDKDPVKAMEKMVFRVRHYYFFKLNNSKENE